MKLVDMKIDPKKREEKYAEATVAGDSPIYPYGLSLTLDDDVMQKLGLAKLPAAETEIIIHAKATVTNSSVNETKDGKRVSMTVQITALNLKPEGDGEKESDSDVLFASRGTKTGKTLQSNGIAG